MFNVIQSLGLWQQCISMSCCCGIGEKPSGLDALLRIMCKYCRRVPEGVLVRVFFKSKWSLTASGLLVLVGLLFRFTSTVVGAKQANKAKSTNHLILFEPHYCDCNPKFLNPIKTNHWFKSIKMDRFSGQLAFVTSDLVQHSIKKAIHQPHLSINHVYSTHSNSCFAIWIHEGGICYLMGHGWPNTLDLAVKCDRFLFRMQGKLCG